MVRFLQQPRSWLRISAIRQNHRLAAAAALAAALAAAVAAAGKAA